ncbi:MAG: lytic transglycosylase domain-containing protein, partial [Bacteriovoracia bacterium]
NPTNKDLRTVKRINSFITIIKNDRFNKYVFSKTFRSVRKNPKFHDFLPWLKNIKKIVNSKSLVTLFKNQKLLDNPTDSHIEKLLATYLQDFYFNYALQRSSQHITYTGKVSNSIYKFYEENLNVLTKRKHLRELNNLLFTISPRESKRKIHFTNSLAKYFIQNKKSIPLKFLQYLDVDTELTTHIQNSGINDIESQQVYYQEFRKLYFKLRNLASTDESTREEININFINLLKFFNNNKDKLPMAKALDRLLVIGKILRREKYENISKILFTLVKENGNRSLIHEAIFEDLWVHIMKNDYSGAHDLITKHSLLSSFSNFPSKLQFWISYVQENIGNEKLANKLYQKIIASNPVSFYAIFASKRPIVEGTVFNWQIEIPEQKFLNEKLATISLTKSLIDRVTSLRAWSTISKRSFVNATLKDITLSKDIKATEQEEFYTLLCAYVLNNSEDYLSSFSIIYKGLHRNNLQPNSLMLKTLFPKPFISRIEKLDNSIDPLVVLSLIRQESAFNPKARSHVGATGLMQLMPATARSISRRVSVQQLTNPSTNLKIGIKYFKYLYEKYNKNLIYTLAAYNAGEHRVKHWKKIVFTNPSLLHTIESIPFDETRRYVQLIFRNIYFYKMLSNRKIDQGGGNAIYDVALN